MRFATHDELNSLLASAPIESILKTQDGLENFRPQDRAIRAAISSWDRFFNGKPSHAIDARVENRYREGHDVPVNIIGILASDGVYGIFTRIETSDITYHIGMHVVDFDSTGAKSTRIRPMRSVEMELCERLTQPALPDQLEIIPATGPARRETKSGPRI